MQCLGFVRPGHYHSWFEEVTDINFDWEFEDGSGSGDDDGSASGSSEEDTEEDGSGFESIDSEEFLSVYWK